MADLTAQTSPLAWNSVGLDSAKQDTPKQIKESARQFEALMIGQMMKSAREAGDGGWLGTGDDKAGSTMCELAEQQIAQLMASQGGFGLATMIEQGLTREAQPRVVASGTSTK
jgi:Rod binding domain-containing protein